MWILLTLLTLSLWGISGVTQKLSTDYVSTEFSCLVFTLTMVPLGLGAAAFSPVDLHLDSGTLALGVAGGAIFTLGEYTTFAAFTRGGKASIVVPIISMFPIVTVIGAYFLFGERISALRTLGIVLAPVAAWLLCAEDRG